VHEKDQIKILVVDDRQDNLLSISSILERENYTTVKASSGRAALKILLQETDFSLILMDVQMPDMNGFETASMIYQREKLKNIPIIFITAFSHGEEDMFQGYKAGAVDFLYKPVNPELLRVKVGLFVELYRKTQSLEREIEERQASELRVRELNNQLIQNNMQLKAANEELDRFAYIASHDLQEPLRKIRMFSDLILQKKPHSDEIDKHIVKITNATERMQQLVNDLLHFSRHSVSKGDFIEVNLNGIVQEAVRELDHQIQQTNTQVMIDPLPAVYAIPTLMQQVFYNLIGNAIKFRKKEGVPQVHIYAKQETPPKETVNGNGDISYYNIYIKDNGIGFETKYLEDIFIVFKRLHSYHDIEGSGIGLSICKKIMEQHNGFITAESELNNGATFIIGLPRVK